MLKPCLYRTNRDCRAIGGEPRGLAVRGRLRDRFVELWAFGRYVGVCW